MGVRTDNADAAVQQQRVESNVLTGEQRIIPVTQPVPPTPTPTPTPAPARRKTRRSPFRSRMRTGIVFGPGRANRITNQNSTEYEQLLQRVRDLEKLRQ